MNKAVQLDEIVNDNRLDLFHIGLDPELIQFHQILD